MRIDTFRTINTSALGLTIQYTALNTVQTSDGCTLSNMQYSTFYIGDSEPRHHRLSFDALAAYRRSPGSRETDPRSQAIFRCRVPTILLTGSCIDLETHQQASLEEEEKTNQFEGMLGKRINMQKCISTISHQSIFDSMLCTGIKMIACTRYGILAQFRCFFNVDPTLLLER